MRDGILTMMIPVVRRRAEKHSPDRSVLSDNSHLPLEHGGNIRVQNAGCINYLTQTDGRILPSFFFGMEE